MIKLSKMSRFIYWNQGFNPSSLGSPYAAHSPNNDSHIITSEESQAAADKIMGRTSKSTPSPASTQSSTPQNDSITDSISGFLGGGLLGGKKAFEDPIQKSAATSINQNLQPGQQSFEPSNPISGLVETGKNVVSGGLDYAGKALQQPTAFGKFSGLAPKMNQAGNTLDQASQAVGGQGGRQAVDSALGGIDKFGGGLNKIAQGFNTPLKPGEHVNPLAPVLSNTEGSNKVFSGLNDLVGGGMETAFSPAQVLPQNVKQGLAVPFDAFHSATETSIRNLGIDPKSDMGKNLTSAFDNALQVGLVAYGAGKGEPGKVGELNKVGDLGKEAELARDVVPETKFKTPDQLSKDLLRTGMKENYVNGLKSLNPEMRDLGTKYLDAGLEKLRDPIKAKNVFDIPGKEIENFVDLGTQKLKTIGQQLGDAKENLAGRNLETASIQSTLNNVLKKLNIKQVSDGLDFSKSELNGAGSVTAQLENIWNQVKKGTMDARDAEAVTGQIDNITGQLKNSGFNSNIANRALSTVKSAINESLGKVDENFGSLNKQFASLSQDLQQVKNATKVPLGNGKFDYNGQQLLRRVLGNAPGKYAEALDAMKRIESNHGIEAPKNLQEKAFLADMAEKYTGSNQPQSLQGVQEMATKRALEGTRIGGWVEAGKQARNWLDPEGPIAKQASKIQEVLSDSIKPTSKKGVFSVSSEGVKAINDLLIELAKHGLPIATKVQASSKK